MLEAFDFPINPGRLAETESETLGFAAELGYPVVLKTAEAGILHKTDCDGVVLNIENIAQLKAAYTDLSRRLGPKVLISPMLNVSGVEMVLGLVHDEQFGPLVMRPLLDGLRNRPAVDIEAFCAAAERFSIMAGCLGEVLNEVDINPLIVHPEGCIAVDALVAGKVPETTS